MNGRKITATLLLAIFSLYDFCYPFVLQDDKVVIAIVDFRNTSPDDELDYLQKTIPESISTTMAKGGRLEIVERSRLQEALTEMEMSELGIVDESRAAEIGRAVGANAILVGSFVSIGGTLRINARLIDVQTSRIIKAETVQGQVGPEIFNLMDQMASSMEIQLLGEATPEPAVAVAPAQPVPETTQPVQQQVVVKKKTGRRMFWIMALCAAGGAGYYYYYSQVKPATVSVTVNIQP